MRAVILGAAAGGGFPQWNCRCAVCRLAWAGDPRVPSRLTQSCLAATGDGEGWVLLNCSPDIREQIATHPSLQPQSGNRHSPISAVVLTNADVDHVGGLLSLRERWPLTVWSTGLVRKTLQANRIFDVLSREVVSWREFAPGRAFRPVPGLLVEPFIVPGKVPLYLEGAAVETEARSEAAVGLALCTEGGARVLYVPGCAAVDDGVRRRARESDVLLFDGTVFRDDEMITAGVGEKTGRRMGHLPMSGTDGSLASFRDVPVGRRIYVHINNTNPVLVAGSPEREAAEAAGWEIGRDGMEVRL